MGFAMRPVYGDYQAGINLQVSEANAITNTGARIFVLYSGDVENISKLGIRYATSSNDIENNYKTLEIDNSQLTEAGQNFFDINGLGYNTTCYYRAFATINGKDSLTNIKSFTTDAKYSVEWVDLGLPSGLKWAKYNLGAKSEDEYGNFFAWGDNNEKYTSQGDYDWNYIYQAPYLVSRYDTTTGEEISLERRIGLLDRKMRVINENVKNLNEWKKWAKIAYHNIDGFEWQGDNLLLAREALFYTLLDYYEDVQKRLGMKPKKLHPSTMQSFAYIISWNIWQMDGLKFVIPETCKKVEVCTNQKEIDAAMNDPFRQMFPEEALPIPEPKYELQECPGCASGEHTKHTGIYSKIRDWGVFDNDHKDKEGKTGKERCDRPFIEIYNETKNKR